MSIGGVGSGGDANKPIRPAKKQDVGGKGMKASKNVGSARAKKMSGLEKSQKKGIQSRSAEIASSEDLGDYSEIRGLIDLQKNLYQRSVQSIQSATAETIKFGAEFGSHFLGSAFRDIGNLFYDSAQATVPEMAQNVYDILSGGISEEEEVAMLASVGVEKASELIEQNYTETASLTDRRVQLIAETVASVTEEVIAATGKALPKVILKEIIAISVSAVLEDIAGVQMESSQVKALNFCILQTVMGLYQTGEIDFTDKAGNRAVKCAISSVLSNFEEIGEEEKNATAALGAKEIMKAIEEPDKATETDLVSNLVRRCAVSHASTAAFDTFVGTDALAAGIPTTLARIMIESTVSNTTGKQIDQCLETIKKPEDNPGK